MKTVLFLVVFGLVSPALAKDTYVKGYVKKDGTYVEPHYRTNSNNTVNDNYSTKGNTNPYTGKSGTKDVYDSGSFNTNSND